MTSHPYQLKVALGLLVSLAALFSVASPSVAATTNVTWKISGHTVTHWDGVTRVVSNPSGTTICVPASTGTRTVVTHVNDATGALHVNGAAAWSGFEPEDINIAGTNYQMEWSGNAGTTTGSLNSATGTLSLTGNFSVRIRNCAGNSLLCTFNVSITLSGHNYNGSALPATGKTATMNGSVSAPINPVIGCNVAIRPTLLNSTVSGTFHFTAH